MSLHSHVFSVPAFPSHLSLAPKENSVEIPRRCRPAFSRLLAWLWLLQAISSHTPRGNPSLARNGLRSSFIVVICCHIVVQSFIDSPTKQLRHSAGLPDMPRCCNSLSRRTSLKIPAAKAKKSKLRFCSVLFLRGLGALPQPKP